MSVAALSVFSLVTALSGQPSPERLTWYLEHTRAATADRATLEAELRQRLAVPTPGDLPLILLWADALAQRGGVPPDLVRTMRRMNLPPPHTPHPLLRMGSRVVPTVDPDLFGAFVRAAQIAPEGGFAEWLRDEEVRARLCDTPEGTPTAFERPRSETYTALESAFCMLPASAEDAAVLAGGLALVGDTANEACLDIGLETSGHAAQYEQAAQACVDSLSATPEVGIGAAGVTRPTDRLEAFQNPLIGPLIAAGAAVFTLVASQIWMDARQEDQQQHDWDIQRAQQAYEAEKAKAEREAACGECTCENQCVSRTTSEPPPPPTDPTDGNDSAGGADAGVTDNDQPGVRPSGAEESLTEGRRGLTSECEAFGGMLTEMATGSKGELGQVDFRAPRRDPRTANPNPNETLGIPNLDVCGMDGATWRDEAPACSLVVCEAAYGTGDVSARDLGTDACCRAYQEILVDRRSRCLQTSYCDPRDPGCCQVGPSDPSFPPAGPPLGPRPDLR